MSTSKRRTDLGVIRRLAHEPQRFEFFQAVRLLQQWLPETPRGSLVPSQLRFRNSIALGFPVSEIESLKLVIDESVTSCFPSRDSTADSAVGEVDHSCPSSAVGVVEMVPAVMGLLGVTGALPSTYTDLIAQRELYHRDHAARAFLDNFSNRAVAMFYAAWKKGRLALQYEEDRKKNFAPIILALGGLGQSALLERLEPEHGGISDESLAYVAATLQQRVLSARQLQQVLRSYLQVPVRLEQFAGRWYTLPVAAQTSLGCSNGILGKNALMGERVWQRDLRVKIFLGPLDPVRFRRFLPGEQGALALRKMLGLLCGASLEFEINLELEAKAVRGTRLSSSRAPTAGRLGWDTYLLTRASRRDRCDVHYDADQTLTH